jgi:ABC-type antimicrobial peptide transport system, permease component
MLKNYLQVAFRNFWQHKVFSVINVAGLAIGISASLVIYLIVQHEYSYDKHHKDGDRIYRVTSIIDLPDLTIHNSGAPIPTAAAIREEVPGVESVTQFMLANNPKVSVQHGNDQAPVVFRRQTNIVYADEYYFKIFPAEWLAGSPNQVLTAPFNVVLTESRAKQYFSYNQPEDILGRQLFYDDSIRVSITGVIRDIKTPTHFTFKEFISRATIENSGLIRHWNWSEWGSISSSSQLFVKIAENADPAQITNLLAVVRDKHREKKSDQQAKDDTRHFLQTLTDIHFNQDYDAFDQRQAHKPTLLGLLAVALFLLLLGCINFINLTTAQASQRAKEVGIRKTMGSGKRQLVFQFLVETFLYSLAATILSVVISPWLLHIFRDFIPPGIRFASLNQVHVWLFLIGLGVIVTVLAGLYPSFVLTRFKPVTALKNQAYGGTSQTRKAWIRKTLTVTQFVIAQFLVIATIIVGKQVRYSVNKDLGYKRDAIVHFNLPWNVFSDKSDDRRMVLKEKLKSIPGLEKISLSGTAPASGNTNISLLKSVNGERVVETMVEMKYADTAYFDLYGMKLLAGRNLQPSDTTREYVINETYARALGFQNPADALGHFIDDRLNIPIVGVIADFHTKSTHQPIKPLAYSSFRKRSYVVHAALSPQENSGQWKNTLARMEMDFKSVYPEDDFDYQFFDKVIENFYRAEQDISRLLSWSAGLCVFISCLGLLGLVIFITNSRTKEIGVRKVLGASVPQIVTLLSRDFAMLVFVAFVIAVPLSWWAMYNWLQDFVYRTALSWWVFGLTGAGMLFIAMLVLSVRTVRSAMQNPVTSLRTE